MMRPRLLLALPLLLLACCKHSGTGRAADLADTLAKATPAVDSDLPACTEATAASCLDTLTRDFGGARFDDRRPDQASAAAIAVLIARDHHGSWSKPSLSWTIAMRQGRGSGGDALRLATARAMASVAGKHARAMVTDDDARAFLGDVAASIPAACQTYAALARGETNLPPEEGPNNARCVQLDLMRKTGPGGAYGQGLWRAAAGALAVWKDTVDALEGGTKLMSGDRKAAVDRALATLQDATPKMSVKQVAAPAGNAWNATMGEHQDAGVMPTDAAAPVPAGRPGHGAR